MAGRRVLITGVSGQTGVEVARRLGSDPEFEYVAGVDTRRPAVEIEGLDFIEADIRNPLIAKLLPQTEVDTVLHNQIVRRPTTGTSAQAAHDINVIGSLQLLAACEKTPTLRTIVVRGSAGIYGAEPNAPQFFTEDMARLYPLRTRFQRDVAEIENYFETYSRRHASVTTTMLRYQPAIGPSLDTQVTRYLSLPVVPTYLGFDPRIQWIHERDAIDALVAAIRNPVRGPVNVAAEGTIGVTRMLRLAGKLTVPLLPPLFGAASNAGKRAGVLSLSPDFERLLRYGRALDTTRLTEEIGFVPRFTTVAAVEDFLRTHQGRRLAPSVRQAVTRT
jgi:UDP-glucose 4-epimerase